jgi:hypothetical protein
MPHTCKRRIAVALPGAGNARSYPLPRAGTKVASRLGDRNAMQATSDEVLIARIAHGDRLAMHVLYARHRVGVHVRSSEGA